MQLAILELGILVSVRGNFIKILAVFCQFIDCDKYYGVGNFGAGNIDLAGPCSSPLAGCTISPVLRNTSKLAPAGAGILELVLRTSA